MDSPEIQTLERTFDHAALGVFKSRIVVAKRNLIALPGTKEVAKRLARWRKQLL